MNQPIDQEHTSVLIIDDIPENLKLLSVLLTEKGYQVRSARSGQTALKYLEQNTPNLILLDIKMPDMNGFEVCRIIKSNDKTRGIPIIFISALDDVTDKLTGFSSGGIDYITKPFQEAEVLARVNTHTTMQRVQKELELAYSDIEHKVRERTKELKQEVTKHKETGEKLKKALVEVEELKKHLEKENLYLQMEIKTVHNFNEIIGSGKKLKAALKLVEQVANSDTTVLVLGETGTGKELFARAIHNLSKRNKRPLIKVNCAALPANLIESELFGHEKGAFTGAVSQKLGRFDLADKGTIFLDEIGDLPLELQAKLLRVLQEGEFERLGGTKTRKVDVRIIAATNRNLNKLRKENKFRDDLFFRLGTFPIEIPSLRDRIDDIPMLVRHFADKYSQKAGKKIDTIPHQIIQTLQTYHWPGNIRELQNEIERAIILSPANQLVLGDGLTRNLQSEEKSSVMSMDEYQKAYIVHVLELTNGKIKGTGGAAELLCLKPSTLISRMQKLGITVNKKIVDISS